jgi:hypothetical protein
MAGGWRPGSTNDQWCFVSIDTLHLTHCVRPGVVQWEYAKFGRSEKEIHQYFVPEQQTMNDLFSRSMILKHHSDSEETRKVLNAVYKVGMDSAA